MLINTGVEGLTDSYGYFGNKKPVRKGVIGWERQCMNG